MEVILPEATSTEEGTLCGISAAEKDFIRHGVIDNVRADGRVNLEFRPFTVKTNMLPSSLGSARISNEESDVICSVRAELVAPSLTVPDKGRVSVSVNFSSPSEASNRLAALGDDINSFSRRLEDALLKGPLSAEVFRLEDLVVLKERFVWIIFIDILLVNIGGSTFDVASMALVAAMRSARLPKVSIVVEDQVEGQEDDEKEADAVGNDELFGMDADDKIATEGDKDEDLFSMRALRLTKLLDFQIDPRISMGTPIPNAMKIPTLVTVGLVESNAILDMTQEEILSVETKLIGCVDEQGDLKYFVKLGGRAVALSLVASLMPLLQGVGRKLFAIL